MVNVIGTVVLVVVLAAATSGQSPSCPEQCSCESFHSMYCNGRGLTQPPIGHWPNINTLYMTRNNISQLHLFSLSGFPSVVRLGLSENALTVIDLRVFVATPRLTYLYLDNNFIHTVSWSASSQLPLESIMHIFLEKNNLSSLDPDLFAKASPNLYQLHLSDNPLLVQDGRPVLNHPRLSWLFLDRVLRLHGTAGSFSGLPSLQRLFLERSGILQVRAGAFSSKSLYVLSLPYNPLHRFDVAAVDGFVRQGHIDVSYSPFACACVHEDLRRWAVANKVSVDVRCEWGNPCQMANRSSSVRLA